MSELTRQAEVEIVRRRDTLVRERTELLELRAAVMTKLRAVDRGLEDCKAAARFFGLVLNFPPDEREEYERIRLSQREREIAERDIARRRYVREQAAQTTFPLEGLTASPAESAKDAAAISGMAEATEPTAPVAPAAPQVPVRAGKKRPSVREIALRLLREAGSAGVKASAIREYLDKEYALAVHEKTVGMTLYRMSQDGLVRRDGHTWFFGPPSAEAKNPGVSTPGSDRSSE